jgi:hypothetical protein
MNKINKEFLSIIFDYLDLRTKYKCALLNKDYLCLLKLYKKDKLYTNSNIQQLQIILKEWKEIMKTKIVNNSWSPKRKPFNREILIFN